MFNASVQITSGAEVLDDVGQGGDALLIDEAQQSFICIGVGPINQSLDHLICICIVCSLNGHLQCFWIQLDFRESGTLGNALCSVDMEAFVYRIFQVRINESTLLLQTERLS